MSPHHPDTLRHMSPTAPSPEPGMDPRVARSRATVLEHIGEFKIPLEEGVISKSDIVGDFYDIEAGVFTRAPGEITLFKNGGGAHLDLMTARYILEKWRAR